jgi:hypothetical protein
MFSDISTPARDNSYKSPMSNSRTVQVPLASKLLVVKIVSFCRKEVRARRTGELVVFVEAKVMFANNDQVEITLQSLHHVLYYMYISGDQSDINLMADNDRKRPSLVL